MAQLMPLPLPLAVSCFSKIHISFTFLVPAHPGSPGKRAVKRVYVCLVHNMHIFHNPQTSQTIKYFNSKSWITSVLSISHRGMAALNLYSSYILRKWCTNCRKYNSTAHDNQNMVVIAKKVKYLTCNSQCCRRKGWTLQWHKTQTVKWTWQNPVRPSTCTWVTRVGRCCQLDWEVPMSPVTSTVMAQIKHYKFPLLTVQPG